MNLKCYAMIWTQISEDNAKVISREDILWTLDKVQEVKNWHASTGAISIITDGNENDLSRQLTARIPGINFMLLLYVKEHAQGWTDDATWRFINDPQPNLAGINWPFANTDKKAL